MTTRKITIVALTGGIVLGVAATEGFSVYRQSQASYRESQEGRIFQERARCKSVADAYLKKNTDVRDTSETVTGAMLDKVDYSPARNSCVAEVEEFTTFRGGAQEFLSVRDLLSDETLFSVSESQIGSGSTAKRTGEDLDAVRVAFLPRVWDYVMNNADKPVELEKEFALIESKDPPRATTPASPAAEPNDWQTVPSGRPPIDPATGERIHGSKSPRSSFIPDVPASEHKSAGR